MEEIKKKLTPEQIKKLKEEKDLKKKSLEHNELIKK